MTWLVGQLWPLLLVSFLVGAATVFLWGQRRETVEVWEDVPVAPPAAPLPEGNGTAGADDPDGPAGADPVAAPASVTTPVAVDADDPVSPFPVAATDGPAPWEQEELWSRPARVAAPGESRRPKDEWTEAAENWRSWADEATGRGFGADDVVVGGASGVSARDRDLFAADRDLFAADREEEPTPSSSGGAPSDDDEEPVEVFPGLPAEADQEFTADDDFPHARPVEAPRGGDETMDPMDTHDMTDDEREAAEIRRMREQARRGDSA